MTDRQDLESELAQVAAFRTELRRFLKRTEAATAKAGLTAPRYDLLLTIRVAGELRITDLCDRLQLRQTTVTELVKRAEAAGLLERRPAPLDGRASLIRLTAEGERRLLQALSELRGDRHALAATLRELEQRLAPASL
jgi:DNA-binding MarR family transcriptional regulator